MSKIIPCGKRPFFFKMTGCFMLVCVCVCVWASSIGRPTESVFQAHKCLRFLFFSFCRFENLWVFHCCADKASYFNILDLDSARLFFKHFYRFKRLVWRQISHEKTIRHRNLQLVGFSFRGEVPFSLLVLKERGRELTRFLRAWVGIGAFCLLTSTHRGEMGFVKKAIDLPISLKSQHLQTGERTGAFSGLFFPRHAWLQQRNLFPVKRVPLSVETRWRRSCVYYSLYHLSHSLPCCIFLTVRLLSLTRWPCPCRGCMWLKLLR